MSEHKSELNVYNVLDPKLVWINNHCYRVNRRNTRVKKKIEERQVPMKSYNDNEDEIRCGDDYNDYEIEPTENGRFKTFISVPQVFFSYIIGTKGSRRKHLEEETKTQITVPKQKNSKNITISGPTERNVATARRRIELIAIELRDKHQITHFISFPMISDNIKMNFNKFKESLLTGDPIKGVEESIFQKTDKLHLTIGTFVLLDSEEKDEAVQALRNCKKEIIDPIMCKNGPLSINMKGLQYMNDDPSQVDVLYAKVHVHNDKSNNILQEISNQIVEYFYRKGLIKRDYDKVKLHVTLINTRYRKESNSEKGDHRRYPKRVAFDARPVMEKYNDYDFGLQSFSSIHLSDRFAVAENGYYECLDAISCI